MRDSEVDAIEIIDEHSHAEQKGNGPAPSMHRFDFQLTFRSQGVARVRFQRAL
jgi:hypothetical protein